MTNQDNTLYAAKLLIGRSFNDKEVKDILKLVPYEIIKSPNNNDAWVSAIGEKHSPSQATKDAGKIAGLDVLRIIHEPTAAALAYGMDKNDGQTIVVFDLGDGTFDVSILEISGGVFVVKATNGDNMLGGEDFDEELLNYLLKEIKKDSGIDLAGNNLAMQRFCEAAEKSIRELGGLAQTDVSHRWCFTIDCDSDVCLW